MSGVIRPAYHLPWSWAEAPKFPVLSLFNREFGVETGSLETGDHSDRGSICCSLASRSRRDRRAAVKLMRKLLRKHGFVEELSHELRMPAYRAVWSARPDNAFQVFTQIFSWPKVQFARSGTPHMRLRGKIAKS